MMTKFSIVICAYNSRSRIGLTLKYLTNLDYPTNLLEVILVDNNSSDDTGGFASSFWEHAGSPFKFRVVKENIQGLSHARKRGVLEAESEYVVFCDDDNWLSSDYLTVADRILKSNKQIGILGGQSIPVTTEGPLPGWFYTYAGCFAVGVQGQCSGDISGRGYVWGAGAIIFREPLVKIYSAGYELLLSGRKGDAAAAGEDSELSKWYLLTGYLLWYEEKMIIHHFMTSDRLTTAYLEKLIMGMSESRTVLMYYEEYIQNRIDCLRFSNNIIRLLSVLKYWFKYKLCSNKVYNLADNIFRLNHR